MSATSTPEGVTVHTLINIDVPDLALATAFYTSAFGLAVGRRLGGGAVELVGASSPIYLLQKEPGSTASPSSDDTRRYERHWTPVHLDVAVADLDAAVVRALAAGAILEDAPRSHDWGAIAHMADPFGHGFCLIQFTARGYDAIDNG
jgi:predicted enzyme related to lactoylglutathione lyase